MSVANYGPLINWDTFPSGLWNGLTYVPQASIIVGLPGRDSSGDSYPWALRPDPDNPESSVYWGPTVSESWFDGTQDHILADWRPAVDANGNNFSGTVMAGETYSGSWGIDGANNTPLLANSSLESIPINQCTII